MNLPTLKLLLSASTLVLLGSSTNAAHSAMSQAPMTVQQPAAPLVMLSVGRDERLYYPVYNNYSDIDGDGTIDIDYKPGVISYFGLFDANKCYSYSGTNSQFEPLKPVVNAVTKTCGQSVAWSGDWLNYVTTSRMDALRRVFYGGKRIETDTTTVLERAYIPQDAHAWGSEFNASKSTFDIRQYTPFATPAAGTQHLFANTTLNGPVTNAPLLRALFDRRERVFNWIAKEGPVAATTIDPAQDDNGANIAGTGGNVQPTDYVVRVQVCVKSSNFSLEPDCKGYPTASPTVWRPTGVLHDYGENKSVAFGLITGSYDKARAGGVLRKNIGYFTDEIDSATGRFIGSVNGIVGTFDKLRISQWQAGGYVCTGGCKDYGNPIAEIMYEGLRYLGSGVAPTPAYAIGTAGTDNTLGLALPNWKDPYRSVATGGFPACAKPTQMVVSDVNPTFDSDDLPGSSFGAFTAPGLPTKLGGLNVTTLGQSIWTAEGLGSKTYFIGESLANLGNTYDAAPTPKFADSFGTIRGLAPSDPTRKGSYYAAAVANFGAKNPITTPGNAAVNTYAIALAPSIPSLAIPTGTRFITIAPFGKSVGGGSYGEFVPGVTFLTNRIVGFYFEKVENILGFPFTAANGGRAIGTFRVSFEDNEQGTDNDMDAIVRYQFQVNADDSLTLRMRSEYASGGINQNLGFVISGSTADGAYLGVRDIDSPAATGGNAYVLNDSANSFDLNVVTQVRTPAPAGRLALNYERTFVASTAGTAGGAIPQNPLWYAAKYGSIGAVSNTTSAPPPNYAFVSDPARLRAQIAAALDTILTNSQPATSVGTSGGVVRTDASLAFSSNFLYAKQTVSRWNGPAVSITGWKGGLDALRLNDDGTLGNTVWSAKFPVVAAATIPGNDFSSASAGRIVVTRIGASWSALDNISLASDGNLVDLLATASAQTLLAPKLKAQFGAIAMADAAQLKKRTAEAVANYIKGDPSLEVGNSPTNIQPGPLRIRDTPFGDIVNSVPVYDGPSDFGHGALNMPGSSSYGTYVSGTKASRTKRVWVGANDGMLHAFEANNSASSGNIAWSFIPKALHPKLVNLVSPSYAHEYFMDGKVAIADVFDGTNWRTIVVAATGAGARSIVAIDATGSTPKVLWEIAAGAPGQAFDDLGYVLGRLEIVRVNKGTDSTQWAVIFGNGYESAVQNGQSTKQVGRLFVLDALTGAKLGASLTVPDTTGVTYNGLGSAGIIRDEATVAAAGVTRSSLTAWAGDLAGNVWRFRMTGEPSKWRVESYSDTKTTSRPLFTAKREAGAVTTAQPITGEPTIIRSLSRGYYVSFGTGKFFEDADRASEDVQSLYTVRDLASNYQIANATSTFLDKNSGLDRTNLRKFSIASQTGSTGGNGSRTLSSEAEADTQKGWYLDFDKNGVAGTPAERIISSPVIFLPYVYAGTFQPTADSCTSGSSGWFMALGVDKSGQTSSFDIDGDGVFETTGANGARTSGGFSGAFGLVASADGTKMNFVGLPGAFRNLAQGSGDKRSPAVGVAKRPNTGSGRTGWRQIQ